jgi:hypothetical protein
MKTKDIIGMAREAGFDVAPDEWHWLERFAALVAAEERQRFAEECIDLVGIYGGPAPLEAAIRAKGGM